MIKNNSNIYWFLTSGMLLLLTGCVISHVLPYYMGPYIGKVVDVDTGEPIAGAVVMVIYSVSSASPAGMLSKEIDAQETQTDVNGEFILPEVAVGGTKYSGYPQGRLKIFKPGYGTIWHPRSQWYCPEDKPPRIIKRTIERDKYIVYQLPKLETIKERRKNLPSAPSFTFRTKLITYTKAINTERIAIGYQPYTLPDTEDNQSAK